MRFSGFAFRIIVCIGRHTRTTVMALLLPNGYYGVSRGRRRIEPELGSTICPMSEIVCFPVLIFTYSHVENSLFFALDLAVSL